MISVFGSTGFVGGTFSKIYYDNVIRIPREDRNPQSNTIVYFLSTNSNYNIFEDSHIDVNTNLNILLDVLDNCKGKEITFNYISTGFVYGNDILNAKETDYCDPGGFYSITKRAAEQLLISYCNTFNIKYRIIRCSSVYGNDKTRSNKKNVLGYMINLLKKDEEIILYDNGKYYRDYTHVNDVAKAIKKIIDCGELNSVYNLGTGDARLYRDIIYMAKDIILSNSKITSVETPDFYKKSQAKNFTLNVDKLKSLGFIPSIQLEDGLRELCLSN
jgi:nucleoside-diphosphate-sugar epimerase